MRAWALGMAWLAGAVVPAGARAQARSAAEVVAVEQAFAARVRESGVKAGFTEYLAPDGVVFRPGPVNGREFFAARPPSTAQLSWRPAVADISAAGDLGYSTGPYEASSGPGAPVAGRGWYLSVWRRQADGTLRLLADHGMAGTPPPDSAGAVQLWPAAVPGSLPAPDLRSLDAAAESPAHELVRTLARGGLHAGAAARASLFAGSSPQLSPIGGAVASSADLGYTYGSYAWGDERGYYLRIWRLAGARWVVVAETISPTQ